MAKNDYGIIGELLGLGHSKGNSKRTKDKHQKVRPGTRQKPNFKSYRKGK